MTLSIFGRTGKGIAGMRAPVKFALITAIGLVLGWFFYAKLDMHTIHNSVCRVVGCWCVDNPDLRLRRGGQLVML